MRDILTAMADKARGARSRFNRSDLGSALLVVMGAAAILFVTAAAVVGVVMFQQTQQARAQAVVRATGLAQQGMEVYLAALRTDDEYWSQWPKITGTGVDGTWTVNADRASKTVVAVGRERGSGVMHLIRVVLKQEESASDYTIVSGGPLTLGNEEQSVEISGSVRGNAQITLAQDYDDVIFFNTSGGVVNAGGAHVIEKFSPADFARPEKSLPNLLTAAKRGGSAATNLVDKPLVFSKGRINAWGSSGEAMSGINATGLVGVGIDLSRETNAGTGEFKVRSVWTPDVVSASGTAPSPAELIDFARQDPVWATGFSTKPLSITRAALNPNGNNVIYVAGDLDVYVKGTFFSSVTIVSERDIYVIGPITRAANTTATVGLVANRNIYICSAMPTSQNTEGTYQTRDGSANAYSGQTYTRGSSATGAYGEIIENGSMTIEADMMAIKGAIIMDPLDPDVVPATPGRRAGTLFIKGSLIAMQGLKGGNFANSIGRDSNGVLKGGFQRTVIGGKVTTDTAPLFPQIGAGGVLAVLSWEEYTISEDPNTGPYAEVDGTGAAIGDVDAAEQPVEPVPWAGDETTPTTEANVSTSELRGQTIITLGVSDITGDRDLGADCVTWYQINGGTPVAGRTIVVPAIAKDTTGTVTVTYWSEDGNGREEEHKTLVFQLRGVDTLPAATTVFDSWDEEKTLIPNGYPQVGQPPLRVYGNFVPEFTSLDTPAGLGVEQLWVSDNGVWQPLTVSRIDDISVSASNWTVFADPEGTWGFKTHRIEYFSIDKAGNLETTKTLTIIQHALDKTAPNTRTDMVVSPLTGMATFVGKATVTLTARDDDEGQGAKDTYYQVDGGAKVNGVWTAGAWNKSVNATEALSFVTTFTVDAPAFGAEPATHTVSFYSRDRATIVGGAESPNVEQVQTVTFIVGPPLEDDKVKPVTVSDAKTSYEGPAVINLTATDAGGLDKIYWKLDGGSDQIGARIDVQAPWSGEASHTIEFWAVDLAGNVEDHHVATFTVTPERIAPITSAHNFELYSAPATFELTAADNEGGSGVAVTYYKIDTGEFVPGATTPLGVTPVFVTGDGEHVVTYYSVDNAGNAEAPKTCVLRIDTTAPTTTDDARADAYTGAAMVNLSAADGGSGVGQTFWRNTADGVQQVSNPVLLGAGTWEVQYWSVDNAGNVEAPKSFHVTVTAAPDTSAPESYDDVKASYKAGTNPPAIIKLYSWDVQSGVDKMHYVLDGVTKTPFAGVGNPPASYELAVSGEGTHTLEYWAVDLAGNTETPRVRTFRIDTISPVTSSSARNNASYWSTQEFSLQSTDTGSGVKATYYSLDGGVAIKATNVYVPAPTDGFPRRHVLQFWSVDNAGNIEVAKTVSFTSNPLDDIAPTTYSDAASAYKGSAIISLTARDNYGGSGIAWTKYRLDNGPETTGTVVNGVVAIPVVGSGPHTLEFWSSDVAGNIEAPHKSVTYVVDGLAPTTVSDARSLYNTPAVIHLSASDAADGSTVANTFYKLDSAPVASGTPPITTINVAAAGSHTLLFWSVDGAGNTEATKTVTFKVDLTKPVTTSDAETEYWGNANIVLTASDEVGGSGVAYTYYKVDNLGTQTGTAVSVSGPASGAPVAHTVLFWSVDAAGNIEDQHTVSFTVAPMADITFSGINPPENGTIAVRNPTIQITGHANVSTVASATAKLDGVKKPVTLTYDGGYWVTQGYQVDRYWVDGYWDSDGCDSWWVDGFWVEAYWVDTSYYAPVDYTTARVSFPVTGLSNGQHWVAATFINAAGATKTKTWMFTVAAPADVTAPVTTSNAVAMYSTPATITLSSVDETGGTGVASTYYKLDGNAQQAGTPPTTTVVVSAQGSHTLEYWAVDGASNKETTKTVTFMVDMTPPTTTAGASASYAGTATVYLSARDNAGGSGVKQTYFKIDSGASTVAAAGPASGVIGQWRFDEGSGTSVADSSGKGFTGTASIGSGGTQGSAALAWTNGASGRFAKSLYFDGTDDWVNLGSQAMLNNLGDTFSVSAWVKTTVNSGQHVIASRGNDWRLLKSGNAYTFEHRNGANNIAAAQAVNTSTDWVHVVGTFDAAAGTVKLYLNGVLVDTKAQTGTTRRTQTQNQIGNSYAWHADTTYNDYFWTGQLDEVTISAVTRTAAEIQSYYAACAGGDAAPLPVTVLPPVSGPPVSHTVTYWSVDNANNVETTKTATTSVSMQTDSTPPTTTSNVVASYLRPTNITLTATDNAGGWGVAYTRYQLDTTTGVWATGTAAPTGGAGTHTLYYYSVDAAGNTEPIKNTIAYTVAGDSTPPVTTSNALESYSGPNSITLSATDGTGWGVDKTYFRVDGGPTQTGSSVVVTAPVSLTPVSHVLDFWSVDLAGNKETTKTASYAVSGLPAGMTYSGIAPAENSSSRNVNPTITITGQAAENILGASATLDGVSQAFTITYGGGYWIDEGYWSYDWVDNGCDTWQEWVWHPVTTWVPVDQTKGTVTFPATGLSSGPHTVSVTYNLASGAQGRKTWSFLVDLNAPNTTSNAASSYVGTATITLTPSDGAGGSGIKWTKYRVDTGADTTGTTIVVPPPTYGTVSHTIYFWSCDNVDNVESPAKSFTFTQSANPDTTSPTTTSNAAATYPAPGTITLTAVDNPGGWGVANTFYRLDNGAITTGTAPVTGAPTGGAGPHTLEFWSVDRATNEENPHKFASYTVATDTVAPTTTSNVQPSYNGTATITLSPVDNPGGWGVANTFYMVDDGTQKSGTTIVVYPPITGTVTHHIDFWSVDRNNNTETTRTATFTITAIPATITWSDWAPPRNSARKGIVTTMSVTGESNQAITSATATVDGVPRTVSMGTWVPGHWETASASVSSSFVGSNQWVSDDIWWGSDWTSEWDDSSNNAWTCYATFDLSAYAGATFSNASLSWSGSYAGEGSGPNVYIQRMDDWSVLQYWNCADGPHSSSAAGITQYLNAYSGGTRSIFWGADNGNAGQWIWGIEQGMSNPVLSFQYQRWVEGTWIGGGGSGSTKATASLSGLALTDGVHNAQFTFTVASGAASSTAWTFYVDNAPPETTSTAVATYTGSAPISLIASDAVSGVANSYYSIDNSTYVAGTSFTVPGPTSGSAVHHIDFWSVDRAGNMESARTATFTINANYDGTAPVTTNNIQRWYRQISTITLTPSDSGWGVNYTKYQLYKNGVPGAVTTGTTLATGDGEGNYVLYYWSVDKAGNQEATRSAIFGVDWTPPSTTSSAVATYSVTANISLTATDNLSGVSNTYYTIDDGVLRTGTSISVPGPAAGTAAHHIDFYSTDVAGNQESPKTATFTITAVQPPMEWSAWTPAKLSTVSVRNPSVSVRGKAQANITGVTATLDGVAKTPVTVTYSTVTTTTTTWVTSGHWGYGAQVWVDGYWVEGHWEDNGCDSWWVDTYYQEGYWYSPWVWIDTSGWVTATNTVTDLTDATATFSTAGLADGVHTVAFVYTVTGGGQAGESWTFTVFGPDDTAPTTTSNALGSYVGTATISLTATDNAGGSGVRATYYKLDGGATTTGTVVVVPPPAWGAAVSHTIQFWSVDNNNNTETAKSVTFTVAPMPDTVAPRTISSVVPTYTGPAAISLTASDNVGGWGMKGTYYRLDSGTQVTYITTFTVPAPTAYSQAHTLEYWSEDRANNVETPHNFATFTSKASPDSTAPTTAHNGSTVYAAPSTITLTPTDNSGGWGIEVTKYRLDVNGVPGVLTTGTSIPTGSQGAYVLNFWSRDKAGNQEATKTLAYVVDQTAPVTSSNAIGVYNVTANISLVATDNHQGRSGVQYTYYKVDSGSYVLGTSISVPGPGSGPPVPHTIYFYSRDFATNTETPVKSATFTVTGPADVTSPTTSSNRVPFYAGPSTITLTAADNPGGWGVAATYYRVDGGVASTGTAVPTGGTGAHTLEYWSVDNAGNIEIHKNESYTVDTVAPTTTSDAQASYTGTATVRLTPTDDPIGSGVKYTYYRIDGGTQQTGTTITVAPPTFGTASHTIKFWSVDNMNNTESENTATFISSAVTDTWAPVTGATWQATYSKPGTITLTAVDIGWGVKTINYSLDGGPTLVGYTTGTGGIMSASCQVGTGLGGTHTLEFWSTDQASPINTETPHQSITYTVTPDTTPPVTTSNAQSFYTGPAPIVLTATDAGWGVQYTRYKVDSGPETTGTSFTVPETLTGSVSHTIYFYSVDWAGNREATKTATFTVKATPVSIASYAVTPLDGSTVTIANPMIRLTAKASTQNLVSATMLVDGVVKTPTSTFSGKDATVTLNATGLTNGVHNVEVVLTGADGRQAPFLWSFTVQIQTDFDPPTTLSNAVGSYFGTATVALVATDSGSGVNYTRYKVDNGTLTTGTLVTIGGPASGAAVSHTLYFFSVDKAGNVETTKSATFTISPKDVIAPTTTSNAADSYKTPDTILLQASDDTYGTGVAHTYFILDGGAQTEGTMVGTGGQGTHVLEFWSVDVAGNIESPHKFKTYRVDVTAPVTTSDAVPNYTGTAVIHLSVTDVGGSGVKNTYYKVDTGIQTASKVITVLPPASGSAQHTIYFWSEDNAGNVEATQTATFNVAAPADATPPTTTSDAKTTYAVPGLITLVAHDTGGWGVDKTFYKLDGGAQTEGLTIRTGGTGNHTLEFWSVDKAGNPESPHKFASYQVLAADTANPVTSSNAVASYVGSATISLTATDNCGVLPVTYYRVDSGAVTTGTLVRVPGPRSGTASHTLYFWSVDLNGNTENPPKQATFTVQVQPASMTVGSESPAAGSTVFVRNPVISVAATHTQTISDVVFELDGVIVAPTTAVLNNSRASMTYAASALANGTHTAIAQFTDVNGASTTKQWTFTVNAPDDVTAPTTTSDGVAIYKTAAVIKLFAADDPGGTGVASTYYKVDGGVTFTSTNATTTVTVSSSGPHTIEFWSVDRAVPVSNTEYPHKTLSFNVDVTPPVTNSDAAGAYSGTAVIHLNASDVAGTGIANTYYIIDSGATQTGNVVTIPAPQTESVWHTVYFWSVDNAGNIEATKSVETNVWALVDNTAPVTTSDAVASYNVPGVIRLTATDNGGWGVAHTYYRLDGGAQTEATILGTGGAGEHTLEFWSVDLATNVETHHTFTYTVAGNDLVAPTTTSNAVSSYNGTAMISLTATDGAGSGVAHTYYRLDGGVQTESTLIGVSAAGSHNIQFWSVDWAGNTEPAKSATFTIVATDLTPPVTTTNALTSYVGTATVSLTATDVAGTGVRTTFYRLDGGPVQQGLVVVVSPPASGAAVSHSIGYWSVDNAGNAEGENTVSFTVAPPADTTAPTTTHNGTANYAGQATITLTANDNPGGSGVKATYYRLDGGPQQSGSVIIVAPPASGSVAHSIQIWSVDNSNNTEIAKSFSFTVSAVVVTGNGTLSFRWDPEGWAEADVHIENASGTWIASQHLSGYGSDLYWDVTVPAGQNYKLVCDYYYDEWYDSSAGGYGTWSGVLPTNGSYVWWY